MPLNVVHPKNGSLGCSNVSDEERAPLHGPTLGQKQHETEEMDSPDVLCRQQVYLDHATQNEDSASILDAVDNNDDYEGEISKQDLAKSWS